MSAITLTRPIDIEEEFGGSSNIYNMTPLCYYYGSADIQEKSSLYCSLLDTMSKAIEDKLQDPAGNDFLIVKHGGLVIDTPSQFVLQNKLESLRHAIKALQGTDY